MPKIKDKSDHIRIKTGTATRKKGRATVRKILNTAKRLWLQHGYANLTLRKVARDSDISPGHLMYFFKSKEDLFRSLVEDVVNDYVKDWRIIEKRYPDDPDACFLAVMQFFIDDSRKRSSRQFVYQLWALSTHDRFINTCRQQFYDDFRINMRDMIKTVRLNNLAARELDQRTFILCALVEGLMIMSGNGRKQTGLAEGFEDMFCQQALAIAKR